MLKPAFLSDDEIESLRQALNREIENNLLSVYLNQTLPKLGLQAVQKGYVICKST